MGNLPKISVIIPTIEEESVFPMIKKVRSLLGSETEIVIVDKSSSAYFMRLKRAGVKAIRQRDSGVENAIMLGLKNASGELLASIDADGTHELEGLVKGIQAVKSGKADMVLGNRLAGLSKGSMSPYLRFGNIVLTSLFDIVYRSGVHDVLTGLFVMRRDAFLKIRDVRPYRAGIAFFAIELAKQGYTIGEVDIKYYPRKEGKSKLAKSKLMYGIGVASHILFK